MSRVPLLVALAVLATAGCADDGPAATAPSTTSSTTCAAHQDLTDQAYVEDGDPLQTLDLHQPTDAGCSPIPVVVWVHGGGWQTGDKGNRMDGKVRLWNDAGWAVASVNYRLTDPDDPPATRLLAPAHDEDVAAALGWLVDHADDLGLDPDHVALLGHSAGAGIVAALATDPTYLDAVGLAPTDLGCAAPLDTEGFDIAEVIAGGGQQEQLYRTVFGDNPDAWHTLSPLTHVGEMAIPDLFLVTRGEPARRAQVASFADAVQEADGQVTIKDLTGFSHEDVNVKIGAAGDEVLTPALQDFLRPCLND